MVLRGRFKISSFLRLPAACLLTLFVLQIISAAQAQEAADISDKIGEEAQKLIEQRILGGLKRAKDEGEEIGRKAGEIVTQNPEPEHPMMANDGADPAGVSTEEYTKKDTEALLNDKTFTQCLEDRQVFVPQYMEQCADNCPGPFVIPGEECPTCIPGPLNPLCVPNHYYVSELYFPVYEARVYPGRGMGSFDPTGSYLSGGDKRSDLKLQATRSRMSSTGLQLASETFEEYFGKSPEQAAGESIEEIIPEKLRNNKYAMTDRQPENDMGDPQALHTVVYQTNLHRQATRRRPQPDWMGYKLSPNCFFHTLDNASKKVIAHASYDKEESYLKLAMRAYESKNVPQIGQEAAKSVLINNGDPSVKSLIQKIDSDLAAGGKLPEVLQKLSPSQRAQAYPHLKKGLEAMGVKPSSKEDLWTFYGFTRAPFYANNDNLFTTPLYAKIAHAVSFYSVASQPGFPGNEKDRPIRFAEFTSPGSVPNYTGKFSTVKDPIVFTGKLQVLYPRSPDDDTLGSHCFRPESLARFEEIKSKSDIEEKTETGYNGLRRDLDKEFPLNGIEKGLNKANEVRVAFYTKRVNCYCTVCGRRPYGCIVLHDGDVKKDNFYGTTPLAGSEPTLFQAGS